MRQAIKIEIKTIKDLKQAYMPFISQCGLFIRSQVKLKLGEFIQVEANIIGENFLFKAKVVWLTPMSDDFTGEQIFGLQFAADTDPEFIKQLEALMLTEA